MLDPTSLVRGAAAPILLTIAVVQAAPVPSPTVKAGREVAVLCVTGRAEPIVARFNATMRAAVSRDQLQAVLDQTGRATPVGKRLSEKEGGTDGARAYEAFHAWGPRKLRIQVAFDQSMRIAGLLLSPVDDGPPPPDPRAGYQLRAPLRLPFRGEWWVFWGGPTLAQNYHVAHQDQRHAFDLVRRKSGSTHQGLGKRNEDYYAWDEPILSPAAGKVAVVENGIRDNVPGTMNTSQIYGNYIILEMAPREFLVLCHFKQGSVTVKAGDALQAGQVLGRCGNSGNSSEPHIHLHVQDRKTLGPSAFGLPASFVNYQADGRTVKRGVPVRGQTIRSLIDR